MTQSGSFVNTESVYAGISGVRTSVEQYDLGLGLTLSKTYAHLIAPLLMAFTEAEPGKPHPAPWSTVRGGKESDIYVQLHIPSSFKEPDFYDRLGTVWWIIALIRLRGAFRAQVTVIADRPFDKIASQWQSATILPIEISPRQLETEASLMELSAEDLEWIKKIWMPGGHLMGSSALLSDAFQAYDNAGGFQNHNVALLAVWGALEQLFAHSGNELRYRVAANIAAFLEPPGISRLALNNQIKQLYNDRSAVAHGRTLKTSDPWTQTHIIATRVLNKILSEMRVPSEDDLANALFAPQL
jgi:hypothetical protein